jgi:nucleoside 2-deoxyribosyltransferase
MRVVRTVYLSGPITGLSQPAADRWRQHVSERLADGLTAVNPMRDAVDETVASEMRLGETARLEHLLHGKEILDRNRADIARCDLLLANFLGADRVSIGAIGEVFWADAFRKPVIIVREAGGNIHDHGMINAIACRTFDNLDIAINKINAMLA